MILTGLAAWVVSYAFAYYMSARQGSMYDPSFNYESVFTAAFIISMFALALPYQASGKPLSKLLMGIGKNTFGIFNKYPNYRWFNLNENNVRWYDSVKPFQCKTENDWTSTMRDVKDAVIKGMGK